MDYKKSSKLPSGSKVWITARHSPGKKQSIDAQLNTLREYCTFNHFVIAEEFIDRGISGADTVKRDAFCRMLDLVESNKKRMVDGIICYDSSRLAREFDDAVWARALINRRGYVLEILIGDDYPDGLYGYMMRGAQDYFNAEQIEMIRQKSKDGLRQFVKLRDETGAHFGFWPMGVPWGFSKVFKKLPVVDTITGKNRVRQCISPNYDLWPLGKKLYELRAQGLAYTQIEARTGWLESRGTVDVSKSDVVSRMYLTFYRNPIYFGQLRMKELIIDNYVPAMVGQELWQEVNGVSATLKRGNWRGWRPAKAGKTKTDEALLAGLCVCGLCNGLAYHVTTTTARNRLRYYLCSSKRRLGSISCDNKLVRADILDNLVLNHTLNKYLSPDFVLKLVRRVNAILSEAPDHRPDTDKYVKQVADLNRAIGNLIRLGETVQSDSQIDELSQRLASLQQQKDNAEKTLRELEVAPRPEPIRASEEEIMAELEQTRRQLIEGEAKQVFWQIISKVTLEPGQATIFYRRPLCIYDNYPWEVVAFDNPGYVIQLPLGRTKKHADATTV